MTITLEKVFIWFYFLLGPERQAAPLSWLTIEQQTGIDCPSAGLSQSPVEDTLNVL